MEGNLANLGKILASVDNFTLSADFRSGITATAGGECHTVDDARRLGEAVRGVLGLARLSTPSERSEWLALWDGIAVSQRERLVQVQIGLRPEILEKVLKSPLPGGTTL